MPKTDKTVRYAEGKTYDFSREPPMDTPAGHFTQMVEINIHYYPVFDVRSRAMSFIISIVKISDISIIFIINDKISDISTKIIISILIMNLTTCYHHHDHHDHDHHHNHHNHHDHQVWAGSSAMGVGLAAAADRPGKWIVVVK